MSHITLLVTFPGRTFPGSRDDIIELMTSVGYAHIPDGHQVRALNKQQAEQ